MVQSIPSAVYINPPPEDGEQSLAKAQQSLEKSVSNSLTDSGDAALHSLSVGARYNGGPVRPGLHISLPLDEGPRGEVVVFHFSVRGVWQP